MSRCINQVENIFFPIFCFVYRSDCLGFNRNSTFSFQFHIVQHLRLHLTAGEKTGHLNDTVRQRRFTMVDVCYNTKISNFTLIYS